MTSAQSRERAAAARADASSADATSIVVIIAAGAAILALSFGVRSVFGGVLEPLSREFAWPREIFSLSLAIQNIVWGVTQPFFGVIADRYGDRRALWLGLAAYLLGLALAIVGVSPLAQHLGMGVLVGMGVAGTAFGLVLAVVGRASRPEKRSQNLGLVSALGALGQVALPLLSAWLIEIYDWRIMLIVMLGLMALVALLIPFMKGPKGVGAAAAPERYTTAEVDRGGRAARVIAFLGVGPVIAILAARSADFGIGEALAARVNALFDGAGLAVSAPAEVFEAIALWVLVVAGFEALIRRMRGGVATRSASEVAGASGARFLGLMGASFRNPSYIFLTLGFFVCGFHVAFIAAHFPAFVLQACGDPALGLQALGIVGAMNVLGTLLAGQIGAVVPKNYVLSAIYTLRAVVILVFIATPVTPFTVVLFAGAMGLLWLSTVPLTSALVAGMFGPKHLATLSGFVFLGHQLGSFYGIYFGGVVFDLYNSYDVIWYASIALGVMSAVMHLPVRERPLPAAEAAA